MLIEKTIQVIDTSKAKKNDLIIFSRTQLDGKDGPRISGIIDSIEEHTIKVMTIDRDMAFSVKDLIDDKIRILKLIPVEFKPKDSLVTEEEEGSSFESLKKEAIKELTEISNRVYDFRVKNSKTFRPGNKPCQKALYMINKLNPIIQDFKSMDF